MRVALNSTSCGHRLGIRTADHARRRVHLYCLLSAVVPIGEHNTKSVARGGEAGS